MKIGKRLYLIFIVTASVLSYWMFNTYISNDFFSDTPDQIRASDIYQQLNRIVYHLNKPSTHFQHNNQILFLACIQNDQSFGFNRTFIDYLDLIRDQAIPSMPSNLGLLVSDKKLYHAIDSYLFKHASTLNFYTITLLLDTTPSHTNRLNRHDDGIQRRRRKHIASLRNQLLYAAMGNEIGAVWIDADIMKIPQGLTKRMVESNKDIITPSCIMTNYAGDYDLNAWRGDRTHPSSSEIESIKNGGSYTPYHLAGTKFVSDMKDEGKFAKLDSVGGTMLYVKMEVFRKGVNFPPFYLIGADWDRVEGWDGVETEGLCYVARTLGYQCWGMPHEEIVHSE
ncbi:Anp1-domain-containing protein [Globomyces pollinis-pini]|nr:Anp1-domain-containing protein [Globomyces pollinis-pini]